MKNVLRWLPLALLSLALLIAAICFGGQAKEHYAQQQFEMSLTPTPEPTMLSVMQVTPDPDAPTPEPVLRSGSQGDAVLRLQNRLQELGYYTGTPDGQYGPATRDAVALFQQQNGLDSDGIAGSQTTSLLYSDATRPCAATQDTEQP